MFGFEIFAVFRRARTDNKLVDVADTHDVSDDRAADALSALSSNGDDFEAVETSCRSQCLNIKILQN